MSSCLGGLPAVGLFAGEQVLHVFRIIATLVSVSVVSAWVNGDKIKKLSLFFAHWLAELVMGLAFVAEDAMVTACWTGSNLEGFIKALKFIELTTFNMFALTNLAMCVNLVLIVSSHRTESAVKSVSSPPLLLMLLTISMAFAAPIIDLAEITLVSGTGFFVSNTDEAGRNWIHLSFFFVQFFAGACMLIIVAWLLLFRSKEVKECWKAHARFRFYVGPALAGVAVNLGIGVCGTYNLVSDDFIALLSVWTWSARYVQVALDTFNLYSVLREGNIDERGEGSTISSGSARVSNLPSEGSGASDNISKPAADAAAPPV